MSRNNKARVCVVGDGSWGTTLALLLAGKGHAVRLWSAFPDYLEEMRRTRVNEKFLPGVRLPPAIELEGDIGQATAGAQVVVLAVPTQYLRGVLEKLREAGAPAGAWYVIVSKGIENGTLLRGSQVVGDVLGLPALGEGKAPVAGLWGPSHAEEVVRGLPTTIVAACLEAGLAREMQALFATPSFRVYTNDDVVGVELGGALKNVIAISAGICEGLGFGDNARAALLTRGLAEIARLGRRLGARPITFLGLAGMGDLVATCFSPYSRNRAVGLRLGRGEKLDDILASLCMVAEGVNTTRSVVALAAREGIEMPIAEQVHAVLFAGKDPRQATMELMERELKSELAEFAV